MNEAVDVAGADAEASQGVLVDEKVVFEAQRYKGQRPAYFPQAAKARQKRRHCRDLASNDRGIIDVKEIKVRNRMQLALQVR